MRQRPDQAALRFVEPSALASDRSSERKSWPSTQHRRRRAGRAAPRSAATCCWRSPAALFLLLLHAASGFPTLDALNGDNDSLLRLVQIRDLIGGQGWFDLHQYRMGPDGGFVMHWSRLVDAPIAAIMLGRRRRYRQHGTGRNRALIAWPLALLAMAMFFLIRIGKTVGGDWAILPMLHHRCGRTAFHRHLRAWQYRPSQCAAGADAGRDCGAVCPGVRVSPRVAAGICAVLSLAVGMETLPYVAVAGLYVATRLLIGGRAHAALAAGFGAAFAAAAAIAFVATVPASAWLSAECDAYSIPQFAVAAIAGAGLAAAAGLEPLRRHFATRLLALAGVGAAATATVLLFFPQCLAAPYATLDPRLKTFLLSAVTEAQPIWSIVRTQSGDGCQLLRDAGSGRRPAHLEDTARRPDGSRQSSLLAFLAAAIAVSIWQVRGSMFAIPLATIPLAAWVGEWQGAGCEQAARQRH